MPPRLSDLTTDLQLKAREHDLMRYLSCAASTASADLACERFLQRWPTALHRDAVRAHLEKAATPAGSTAAGNWGKPLIPFRLAEAFVAIVRAQSVLATLPFHAIPFGLTVPREVTGASYAWVAEDAVKPVSAMTLDSVLLSPKKASGIVVLTEEVVALSHPGSEPALRRALTGGLRQFQDQAFLSTAAATPAQPAGILNGVTPITPSGNLATDLAAAITALYAPARKPAAPWWVLSTQTIASVAGLGTHHQLPTTLLGFPVAISPEAGTKLVLLDADQLFVADGDVTLDVSTQAAIQMDSAPASPPTAAITVVDLWANNLIGYKVDRFLNWTIAPAAVAYVG